MTDILNTYEPATAAYIRFLLNPYYDLINSRNNIEEIVETVNRIIPEGQLGEYIKKIGNIEESKRLAIQYLIDILMQFTDVTYENKFPFVSLEPQTSTITPWDISMHKNQIAIRLFGYNSDKVPVTVRVGRTIYIHEMTFELTFGILMALSDDNNISLYINGVQLFKELFLTKIDEIIAKRDIYFG